MRTIIKTSGVGPSVAAALRMTSDAVESGEAWARLRYWQPGNPHGKKGPRPRRAGCSSRAQAVKWGMWWGRRMVKFRRYLPPELRKELSQ